MANVYYKLKDPNYKRKADPVVEAALIRPFVDLQAKESGRASLLENIRDLVDKPFEEKKFRKFCEDYKIQSENGVKEKEMRNLLEKLKCGKKLMLEEYRKGTNTVLWSAEVYRPTLDKLILNCQ